MREYSQGFKYANGNGYFRHIPFLCLKNADKLKAVAPLKKSYLREVIRI